MDLFIPSWFVQGVIHQSWSPKHILGGGAFLFLQGVYNTQSMLAVIVIIIVNKLNLGFLSSLQGAHS